MRIACCVLALACCACGETLMREEQEQRDREAVALVEQANGVEPAVSQLVPETILYPDMERHDIYGASCAYASGTSLGVRVIARQADAYIKINGEMIRFAADPGARELAYGTRSLYNGRDYSLRLEIAGEGMQAGEEMMEYEGTVSLRDRYDRVIYSGTGSAQCGV